MARDEPKTKEITKKKYLQEMDLKVHAKEAIDNGEAFYADMEKDKTV